MSAKDAFRKGLETIDDLYRKAVEWENRRSQERIERNLPWLVSFGLRKAEAEAWLETEPDFTPKRRPLDKLPVYL
jgi:hypothetical protein